MTLSATDAWLEQHPYLQPLANMRSSIETVLAGVSIPASPVPSWADYQADYLAGVPLLRSPSVAIDWRPAGDALAQVIDRLASSPLPPAVALKHRMLLHELRADPEAPHRAIGGLLEPDTLSLAEPGLWQLLAWDVVSRMLRDVVSAFGQWRDEEKWLRSYCPTCGAAPAMAQLVGSDPARLRLLVCGCCRTRWRYRRVGCPFCETEDDHRLNGFAVEGERSLRIDYCEHCNGYLKTYVGEGAEALWLADWTSLHLDVAARERGLNRLAGSLFHF
jgi:FdhE protein